MRKLSLTCLLTVVLSAFSAQMAHAGTVIPWIDNIIHWPGYLSGNSTKDSQDTIGDVNGEPHISGGTVLVNNGYLVSITANFANDWAYGIMKPGDLFLDTNNDGTWDYVLSFYNGRSTDPSISARYTPITEVGTNPYKATGTLYPWTSSAQYLITGPDNQYYWSGYLIRNNHPYAATNLSNSLGNGNVSGGFQNVSPLVYTLPVGKVPFSPNTKLTFGFAENCANDVVRETVTYVPEPSFPLLLAIGIACVSCLAWLKK